MAQNLVLYVEQVPRYHLRKGLVYLKAPTVEVGSFDVIVPWDIFLSGLTDANLFAAGIRARAVPAIQLFPVEGRRKR